MMVLVLKQESIKVGCVPPVRPRRYSLGGGGYGRGGMAPGVMTLEGDMALWGSMVTGGMAQSHCEQINRRL